MPEMDHVPTRRHGSHVDSTSSLGLGLWIALTLSGALFVLLAAVATGITGHLLPSTLASKVGYNSEGYLFALIVTPWVYYVARHPGGRWRMPVAVMIGLLWIFVGWGLLNSSLPSPIKTLNEPALALGVVLPYVTLRRPLNQWVPGALVLGALITIVLGMSAARPAPGVRMGSDNWVIYLGEGVFLVLLTIIALDLVEQWMLNPSATRATWVLRAAFYAILVATPITVSALGRSMRVGDQWSSMILNYLGRVHEAFVGTLLVCGTLLLVSWFERRERNREAHRALHGNGANPADMRAQRLVLE